MRTTGRTGNFFLCLLFNMIINLEWTIPAWILLALHFIFDWRILWFWIALGVWFLSILLCMSIIRWASSCSTPSPYKENKNPYSATNSSMFPKKEDE